MRKKSFSSEYWNGGISIDERSKAIDIIEGTARIHAWEGMFRPNSVKRWSAIVPEWYEVYRLMHEATMLATTGCPF